MKMGVRGGEETLSSVPDMPDVSRQYESCPRPQVSLDTTERYPAR